MIFIQILLHVFLILWLIFIWKIDTNKRLVFTPFVVFNIIYIIFSMNFWLFFQEIDVNLTYKSITLSLLACFSVGIGYVISLEFDRVVFKYPYIGQFVENMMNASLLFHRNRIIYPVVLFCLLMFAIIFGLVYFQGVPPTTQAVNMLITGEELADIQGIVSSGRKTLTKSHVFGGTYRGQGVLKSFLFVSWSYGLLLSLILFSKRRKIQYIVFVLLFFIGSIYFIGGTGERSRIIWCIIISIIGMSYVIKFNYRRIMISSFVVLSVLMIMSALLPRYQTSESKMVVFGNLAESVARRILIGNKISNLRVINLVDSGKLETGFGRQHWNIGLNAIPGIHSPPLAHEVAERTKGKTTTYFSGTYLATVYLDFGVVGVILVYAFLGLFIHQVFRRTITISRRPENIVFIAFISYILGAMSSRTGIISFISNIIPVLIIHFTVLFIVIFIKSIRSGTHHTSQVLDAWP